MVCVTGEGEVGEEEEEVELDIQGFSFPTLQLVVHYIHFSLLLAVS